jgi:hypothetical protein
VDDLPILLVQPTILTIYLHWVTPDSHSLLVFLDFFVANVAKVFDRHKKRCIEGQKINIYFLEFVCK